MGRMKLIFASLVLATLLGITASAQASSPDYHYQGNISIDPESGHLAADWTISVMDPTLTNMNFAIRETLESVEVGGDIAQWSLMPADAMPGMKGMAITMAPSDAPNPRQINMQYQGDIFSTPVNNDINEISPRRIELNIDGFWLPFDLSASRHLTADVSFNIIGNDNNSWTAVTTGDVIYENGAIRIVNKMPALDIAVAMSQNYKVTKGDGFTIYDGRPEGTIDELVQSGQICTSYLNQHFGAHEPLPEGRFVLDSREEGGYARQNFISFSALSENNPHGLTQFVCHELAHFWSSGANFTTVENWLNESFAVFISALAARETYGEDVFEATRQSWRIAITDKDLPPVWVPGDSARKPFLINYKKGPLRLAQLEDLIGREAMAEFVKIYMVDRINSTPDLLSALETMAGNKAREDFQNLLAE